MSSAKKKKKEKKKEREEVGLDIYRANTCLQRLGLYNKLKAQMALTLPP